MGRLGELFRWLAAAATGAAVLGGAQSVGDEARTSTRRADPRGDMVAVLPAQAPHPSLGHHADLFGRFVGTWDADYSFIAQDGSGPGGPWAAARVHPACAAVRRA